MGQLVGKPLKIKKGGGENFVLVYYNNSDKPVYFFAAPHEVGPKKYTLGFKFYCLCINHAFMVKAKHYWYRIVRLNISKHMEGDKLEVIHTLIAIDKKRMDKFPLKKSRLQ